MPETRENRQAERRQRILAAALELFTRQGYERTSTRQIAQAAGVAEGSIFNHFPSKKDLLVAVMAQIVDGYFGADLAAPKADTLDLLRETFRSRLEMGFAHVLGKKIFLLNGIPDMHYKDEIRAMQPVVLDGDLNGIR